MRFEIHQRFAAPVDEVLALYSDPGFHVRLLSSGPIGEPELVDHRVEADKVHLAVRYRFTASLPAAALAVVDADKLTWVEVTDLDRSTATATSRIEPDHYADRLRASARSEWVDDGAGSTDRTTNGDVNVRMLLVGGQVERAIVSGIREHFAAEAEAANERLGGAGR